MPPGFPSNQGQRDLRLCHGAGEGGQTPTLRAQPEHDQGLREGGSTRLPTLRPDDRDGVYHDPSSRSSSKHTRVPALHRHAQRHVDAPRPGRDEVRRSLVLVVSQGHGDPSWRQRRPPTGQQGGGNHRFLQCCLRAVGHDQPWQLPARRRLPPGRGCERGGAHVHTR